MLDEAAELGMPPSDVIEMYSSLQVYLDKLSALSIQPVQSLASGFLATWTALDRVGSGFGHDKSLIAGLMAQVDKSVRAGGATGLASNVVTYRTFSAHGVKDPNEMQYRQEEGSFNVLPDGTFLIAAIVKEVSREMNSKGEYAIDSGGANHLGISMSQFRVLRNALAGC